jgi:hypothetical protein
MCKLAVSQNGQALHFVPLDLRTYDLCLEAVGG